MQAKLVERKEGRARMDLGGCFDDRLQVHFEGFPTEAAPKAAPPVLLTWGDWGGVVQIQARGQRRRRSHGLCGCSGVLGRRRVPSCYAQVERQA